MVSVELLNTLSKLDRADKLHLMQFLISELTQEEADIIKPNMAYTIWSPYDAFEAASTMLDVLKATEKKDHDQFSSIFLVS